MLPTVEKILALPAVQVGRPEVVAGQASLRNAVRWVHICELSDAAELLRGGEFILATGVSLPQTNKELADYAASLSKAGASGLGIELGRRFTTIPDAFASACDRLGLPLIVLHRPVEFAQITEAVHSEILTERVLAIQLSERAHVAFTAMAVDGATVAEVVQSAAKMIKGPVVFEDVSRKVLAFDAAGTAVDALLARWEARSRAAHSGADQGIFGPEEWAIVPVEPRGVPFGRLIAILSHRPTGDDLTLLERAATALKLLLMLTPHTETVEQHAQDSLLTDLIHVRYTSRQDVHARASAMRVPLRNRLLVATVVESAERDRSTLYPSIVADALKSASVSGLLTVLEPGSVGVLLTARTAEEVQTTVPRFARRLRALSGGESPPLVTVGQPVSDIGGVRGAFVAARNVALAARTDRSDRLYFELADVRLRGMLYGLVGDPRLQAFVESTLGPLLDFETRNDADLLGVLRAFLEHRENKSVAAQAASLSRQTFYHRLGTIERVLGADMTSGEVCTSLHAALMGWEALEDRRRDV